MDLLRENPENLGFEDLLEGYSKDLLRMCCICHSIYLNLNGSSSLVNMVLRLDKNSRWARDDHPMYDDLKRIYGEDITHGYCDVCFKDCLKEIQNASRSD